jgi:hypothetical protein
MAALIAAAVTAGLGVWFTNTRRRGSRPPDFSLPVRPFEEFRAPEIDDDTAAEIIKRARASLEKARELTLQQS